VLDRLSHTHRGHDFARTWSWIMRVGKDSDLTPIGWIIEGLRPVACAIIVDGATNGAIVPQLFLSAPKCPCCYLCLCHFTLSFAAISRRLFLCPQRQRQRADAGAGGGCGLRGQAVLAQYASHCSGVMWVMTLTSVRQWVSALYSR